MADARAPQRVDAGDDKHAAGGLGSHATGQGTVESRLLSVEGPDRRLGDVRRREDPFGRTDARSRRQ